MFCKYVSESDSMEFLNKLSIIAQSAIYPLKVPYPEQ